MTKFRASLCFVLMALVLAGCASGPRLSEVRSTIAALTPDKGRIWFYRQSSPFGAALQPQIKLNGEPVGESVPGGVFYHDVAPGDYIVATTTEVERQLSLTIAKGEEKFVRTYPGFGILVGRIYPELVDPATGRSEIESLSYTGQ